MKKEPPAHLVLEVVGGSIAHMEQAGVGLPSVGGRVGGGAWGATKHIDIMLGELKGARLMSRRCEACHERYQDCVVRECPKKPGHMICLYCCRRCKRSYKAYVGWGCIAFDAAKRESAGREEKKAEDEDA